MSLTAFRLALSERIDDLNLAVARGWAGAWFKLDDGETPGRRTGAAFTVSFLAPTLGE